MQLLADSVHSETFLFVVASLNYSFCCFASARGKALMRARSLHLAARLVRVKIATYVQRKAVPEA